MPGAGFCIYVIESLYTECYPLQRLTRQAHGDDSLFAEREYDMHVSVADQDRRITVDAVFVQTDHLAFVLGIIQQKMLIVVDAVIRKGEGEDVARARREGIRRADIEVFAAGELAQCEFGAVIGELGGLGERPGFAVVRALAGPQIVGTAAHEHPDGAVLLLYKVSFAQANSCVVDDTGRSSAVPVFRNGLIRIAGIAAGDIFPTAHAGGVVCVGEFGAAGAEKAAGEQGTGPLIARLILARLRIGPVNAVFGGDHGMPPIHASFAAGLAVTVYDPVFSVFKVQIICDQCIAVRVPAARNRYGITVYARHGIDQNLRFGPGFKILRRGIHDTLAGVVLIEAAAAEHDIIAALEPYDLGMVGIAPARMRRPENLLLGIELGTLDTGMVVVGNLTIHRITPFGIVYIYTANFII